MMNVLYLFTDNFQEEINEVSAPVSDTIVTENCLYDELDELLAIYDELTEEPTSIQPATGKLEN